MKGELVRANERPQSEAQYVGLASTVGSEVEGIIDVYHVQKAILEVIGITSGDGLRLC